MLALYEAAPALTLPSNAHTIVPLPENNNPTYTQHPHTSGPPFPRPLPHSQPWLSPIPAHRTPINLQALAQCLHHYPNQARAQYLMEGLAHGFYTGFHGQRQARLSPNLPSSTQHPQVITEYIAKECASGHTAGPFPQPPLKAFVVNPLGVVPKKRTGKWRLIMHLSFPAGASVNDGIDVADFPLRYSTVYDAMDSVMTLGRHALMAKIDVRDAFRLCPVHPVDHHLLGYRWKGHYYYEQVLPFGLRSAPFIFNCLAEAVEWIARQQGVQHIHHYLDDYFIAGPPHSPNCHRNLGCLVSLCSFLQIPLAEDKQEGPTTQLEYLGILLDSAALEARLPPSKLSDLKAAIASWSARSTCTKVELLSLIGTLSFAAKVVPAGRTFLRRAIDLSSTVPRLRDTIALNEGFRLDLEWWAAFATPWSGRSLFLLPHWTPAPDIHLFTDSSGGVGFGAFYQGEWFNGRWSAVQIPRSIQYKELYPIVIVALTWGERWRTLKVRFFCDNATVVACLTSGSSHCPHVMHLMRNLSLIAASQNFNFSAQHIAGVHNAIADSLSRFQIEEFFRLAPHANPQPTLFPQSLPFARI